MRLTTAMVCTPPEYPISRGDTALATLTDCAQIARAAVDEEENDMRKASAVNDPCWLLEQHCTFASLASAVNVSKAFHFPLRGATNAYPVLGRSHDRPDLGTFCVERE